MSARVTAFATPSVIEWGRRNAGFSRAEVARRLRVSPNSVEQWEIGANHPTVIQLRKLGRVVRRPLAFFYLPEPPQDFDAIRDFRRVPGHEPEPESSELLFAIRMARDHRSIAIELMEELGEPLETLLRIAHLDDNPEMLAARIRLELSHDREHAMKWSSYYEALRFWRDSIEANNILVLQFGGVSRSEVRGFSIGELPLPVIAINRTEWPQARIFSLLHEFVHLALRRSGLCNFIELRESRFEEQRIEVFCNRVAGAILVPQVDLLSDEILKGHVQGQQLDEMQIRTLARRFRVSREVILRRLLIFDRITQSYYESKRNEYEQEFDTNRQSPPAGYAPPHTLAISTSGLLYTRLVIRSHRERRITAADLAEYLGVRLKHLDRIEAAAFSSMYNAI